MNRLGRWLLCALLFLVCPCQNSIAQYYDTEPLANVMLEVEALTEALDKFGLDLDSQELEEMDNGDIWRYIEYLRKERETHGYKSSSGNNIADKTETR